MTPEEYDEGLASLAARYPEFDIAGITVEAWYEDLECVPNSIWVVCLKLIAREEQQWWKKNLVALVFVRIDRVKSMAAVELGKKREAEEREVLPPRQTKEEMKPLFDKLHAICEGKKMPEGENG